MYIEKLYCPRCNKALKITNSGQDTEIRECKNNHVWITEYQNDNIHITIKESNRSCVQ